MKTVRFESRGLHSIAFAYIMYGPNRCVYTGIEDNGGKGSSISHADELAMAICKQEGRSIAELRFFDLQTRICYTINPRDRPGHFLFEEVMFKSYVYMGSVHWTAEQWLLVKCPEEVMRDFSMFIDGDPQQVIDREPIAVF